MDFDTVSNAQPLLASVRDSRSNRNAVVFAIATNIEDAEQALWGTGALTIVWFLAQQFGDRSKAGSTLADNVFTLMCLVVVPLLKVTVNDSFLITTAEFYFALTIFTRGTAILARADKVHALEDKCNISRSTIWPSWSRRSSDFCSVGYGIRRFYLEKLGCC